MENNTIKLKAINNRYSILAETACCLSCGGAIELAEVSPGEVCVDLGSGRGTDVMRMADLVGEEGFAYGIDVSQGMLEKAKRTADKMGYENVKFLESNLESLPLESSKVNVIISNCTINHVQDKDALWKDVYRVLKEGGRFVVSDIYSTHDVPKEYRNDPEAVAECWAGSVTREEYLENLKQAGFTKVDILEESKPYEKGKINVASWTLRGFKE